MQEREKIANIVKNTLSLLGFESDVNVERKPETQGIKVTLQISNDAGMLIGKGGDTLKALQHILLLVVSKETGLNFAPGEFTLDINNYQKDREKYIIALAKNTAEQVLETSQEAELQPMSAADRRFVHLALGEVKGVLTESVGEKKERKIIIKPDK